MTKCNKKRSQAMHENTSWCQLVDVCCEHANCQLVATWAMLVVWLKNYIKLYILQILATYRLKLLLEQLPLTKWREYCQ